MPLTSSLHGGSSVGSGASSRADILVVVRMLTKGMKGAKDAKKSLGGISDEAKKAGKETGKASKSMGGLEGALKKAGVAIGATVAAFYGLSKAINQVVKVGREGAGYIQMQESFDSLAKSVGASTMLLGNLERASMGTIDKMSLMSSAAVAVAGNTGEFGQQLSNALPAILRIAKAAEKANPALGDTGFMFRSLTVGLKRLSPRLIDNTGLQLKLSQGYEKLAKKLGKTTMELTAQEQQQALLNETLRAGNILIQQIGGSVGSATDVYTRFSANVTNTKNSIKAWFSENIGASFVATLDKMIFGIESMNLALADQRELLMMGGASYNQYIESTVAAMIANKQINEEMGKSIIQYALVTDSLGEATEEARGYTSTVNEFYKQEKNREWISSPMVAMTTKAAKSLEIINIMSDYGIIFRKEYEAATETTDNYADALERTGEIGDALTKSMEGQLDIMKYARDAEDKLRIATMIFGDEIDIAKESLWEYRREKIVSAIFTENLTEAETEAKEAELALIDARLDAIGVMKDLSAANKEAVKSTVAVGETWESTKDILDKDIDSPIKNLIDDLRWMLASGGKLEQIFDQIKANVDDLGVETAIDFLEQEYILTMDLKAQIDPGMTDSEMAKTISEALPDVSYTMALEMITSTESVEEVQAKIDELGQEVDIILNPEVPEVLDPYTNKLLSDTRIEQGIDIYVPPAEIPEPLSTLLNNTTISRTINVKVKYTTVGGPPEGSGTVVGEDPNPPPEEQFGGLVAANRPYLVGERGAELFVPSTSGEIISNRQLREGKDNITVNIYADISSNVDVEMMAYRIAKQITQRQRLTV